MIEHKLDELRGINKRQILTFGQFKIFLANGDIYNISSRTGKLWNLFKFLLLNKSKGIPPDIILESLYPEEFYEDPQNAVQNMIYRLRKLLINENIFYNNECKISFSDGCYKLDIQEIWLDFEIFEDCIAKADKCKKENPSLAIELYKIALDIYSGELLPELIYEDWIILKRTYYNKKYIHSVIKLSELYREQREYDLIVQACKKALLIEPHEEDIHILLMENLLHIGKILDAKKHYEEVTKVFEEQFGIKPTKEMKRISGLFKVEYINVRSGDRNISDRLRDEEEKQGAFYCEYRDFYAINILEKRRSERSGNVICPVSIDFENGKNVFNTNTFKNTAINHFKNILTDSLRRGDIFSLIRKTQFFILLPNLEFRQTKEVLERIISKFNKEERYKDIYLEVEVCPKLPENIKENIS